jgi:hypothetical protein
MAVAKEKKAQSLNTNAKQVNSAVFQPPRQMKAGKIGWSIQHQEIGTQLPLGLASALPRHRLSCVLCAISSGHIEPNI